MDFYQKSPADKQWYRPTDFAVYCMQYLPPKSHIVDLCCGNGRDTVLFGQHGTAAAGIDSCPQAIALAKQYAAQHISRCMFVCSDLLDGAALYRMAGVAYARFAFHAITDAEQATLLRLLVNLLQSPAMLMIEARSAGEGAGHCETHDGHYRRLLDRQQLHDELRENNFVIEHSAEAQGWATHGTDDPTVLRIVAKRRKG